MFPLDLSSAVRRAFKLIPGELGWSVAWKFGSADFWSAAADDRRRLVPTLT